MRIGSTGSGRVSNSVDINNTLEWTKIISLFLFLFLALSFLPIFDYHQFLLPLPDQVVVLCRLTNLSMEEDTLGELPDGHILLHKQMKDSREESNELTRIFLYATNLRKEIQCSPLLHGGESNNKTFLYHNVYLNILHQDIQAEMNFIREEYSFPRKKWFYEREKYNHLLERESGGVDRYGLSEEPIDIYKSHYYWIVLIMMKSLLLITDFILTILAYKILIYYQRRSISQNTPVTYYLESVYDV